MSGTVFEIGITACGYTMTKAVEHHSRSIIGTFWLPATPSDFDALDDRWISYVNKDNQAQAILNDIDVWNRNRNLRVHMVIMLTGNPFNPGDYSFIAGLMRFVESEDLLKQLAKYNIPTITEVSFPKLFDDPSQEKEVWEQGYELWNRLSLVDWNEYIRMTLVSLHGRSMLEKWWQRTAEAHR